MRCAPLDRSGAYSYSTATSSIRSLHDLDQQLCELGTRHGHPGVRLLVRHGRAVDEITALAQGLSVQAVYANHDDEPTALQRDGATRSSLAAHGVAWHTSKDHVVFERSELLTQAGKPYTVFTPYKNAWLRKLEPFFLEAYPTSAHADALAPPPAGVADRMPTLADLGFVPSNLQALKIPTVRHRVDSQTGHGRVESHAAGAGWRRARCRRVVVRTDLARFLPPDPAPPPARGGGQLQARIRQDPVGGR